MWPREIRYLLAITVSLWDCSKVAHCSISGKANNAWLVYLHSARGDGLVLKGETGQTCGWRKCPGNADVQNHWWEICLSTACGGTRKECRETDKRGKGRRVYEESQGQGEKKQEVDTVTVRKKNMFHSDRFLFLNAMSTCLLNPSWQRREPGRLLCGTAMTGSDEPFLGSNGMAQSGGRHEAQLLRPTLRAVVLPITPNVNYTSIKSVHIRWFVTLIE